MRNSKMLSIVLLIIAFSGVSLSAVAAEGDALQIQNYQGVPYVTGGVSLEERDYLRTISKDFNLKLMFAVKEGDYLSDIPVHIRDVRNQTVLEAVTDGPYLYANLAPGTYTVLVDGPRQSVKRSVRVTGRKQAELNFYW